MNRFCNTCNIKIDENNFLKERTVCKSCYNKNRRKNNKNNIIRSQQPNVENFGNFDKNPIVLAYASHRKVIIGPSNVGKTYYMLKKLEKIANKRPTHIRTRSANQHPKYRTSNEIKQIDKFKGSVVIFDDMLVARNSSQIVEFYSRGKKEQLYSYYISKSYFALPRQSSRNKSDRILFKKILRGVRSIYYNIGA